jgi:hypothetical protein
MPDTDFGFWILDFGLAILDWTILALQTFQRCHLYLDFKESASNAIPKNWSCEDRSPQPQR